MKVRKRALSSTPAMPITRFLLNPDTWNAACAMASSHYTVDLLAGILTAAALILTAPILYQKLSPKGLRLVGIEISAVDNKKALHEFVELPFAIYRNHPHWVPQLRIAVDRKSTRLNSSH